MRPGHGCADDCASLLQNIQSERLYCMQMLTAKCARNSTHYMANLQDASQITSDTNAADMDGNGGNGGKRF